jgi:hypothetical protein
LTLPLSAVISTEKQTVCCCVVDGRIVRKPITLGLRTDKEAEVTHGLDDREMVVQAQASGLQDGQRVEVARPDE